ncbi:tyrosinase family protein (plasmid) [Bradyrhizobium septentrionale]|uniref:Tyrosinase family protein n=1 Tax=Bradyrhizobium septentrionale TaxID=1404411 RepID=A0A973WA96_9BRAD|nr:tyrosinase family protein [Bradyrhizobium septentrionale]UGY11948.1 tyrosinase family protein [Bradyrhizobium septentrionale]
MRYDVATPEGEKMLEKYARALAKMMDKAQIAESDPKSWTFQWYTHAVAGSIQNEINRVYQNVPASDPKRLLALATWSTCQAHGMNGLPQEERMFLPWHRMYVYYFERIIRSVLGDQTFTLPYWDYTTPGKRAIPKQFRMPNDPLYKVLYRANRNNGENQRAEVNEGQTIDLDRPTTPLTLAVLGNPKYESDEAGTGFNEELDGNLHGAVHVLTGNPQNMGSPSWAARDPIFWLHHCNIDRLWAAWNAGGRKNPEGTFLTQSVAFADENGQRVEATVRDFVDLEKIKVGTYRYDKLPPVPPIPAVAADEAVATNAPVTIFARQTQPQPVRLEVSGATSVPLTSIAVPIATHVENASGRSIFLLLQNLNAAVQPNVLYNVFLDFPNSPGTTPVGQINFFDSTGAQPQGGRTSSRRFTFDVTQLMRSSAAIGTPSVRLVADGQAVASANATVGSVALARR